MSINLAALRLFDDGEHLFPPAFAHPDTNAEQTLLARTLAGCQPRGLMAAGRGGDNFIAPYTHKHPGKNCLRTATENFTAFSVARIHTLDEWLA